jgi:hypothetical protein
MKTVRLFDPAREPQGWLQIIRPTQFAAFATLADSGVTCDAHGSPASADDATCVIFESLPEAEAFCRERVARTPNVRFDIRDSAGLLRPPLLTIVHPSRADALDESPARYRRNRRWAIVLLVIGPPLVWFDWTFYDGVMVVPTIVGINAVLIAVRLLVMNRALVVHERARIGRVASALQLAERHDHQDDDGDHPQRADPHPGLEDAADQLTAGGRDAKHHQ